MLYTKVIKISECHGLLRTKKNALNILHGKDKFRVHNIYIDNVRKIALCNNDEIIHIIPVSAYQEYITPKLEFV